jgi:hypothetical protein
LGTYTYKNFPNADVSAVYLNPPVTGAGQYLIRVDQTAGPLMEGQLATWIDLWSLSSHYFALHQNSVGSSSATANITLAEDDGGGSPLAGTTQVKVVTFNSSVTGSSYVSWGTAQRDLVEIKEAVDADCVLTFNPEGWAAGYADTSGAFTENWHMLSPSAIFPASFTVNAVLVSGTAPTGSALSTNLTLDQVRSWTLLATSDENLSCELDVTVSDGVVSSTTRVTMNSQRSEDSATPVWTTDAWSLSDVAFPQALALVGQVKITYKTDGTANGRIDNQSGGEEQEAEDWLPIGEDKADYEVRLTSISGSSGLISHTSGVWYSLNTQQQFLIDYTTLTVLRVYSYAADVRKIGDLAVSKTITLNIAGDDGSVPP